MVNIRILRAGLFAGVNCALIAGLPSSVLAEPPPLERPVCTTRADLIASLDDLGEAVVARALTTLGKGMIEIFTSPDGSTWTAIMTRPDQCATLLDYGTDWQGVVAPVGSPS